MKTSHMTVDGKQFFTAEWGASSPDCILGIHGLTANCRHMAVVSEHLAKTGRYVLAYDVRGRGESSGTETPSTMRRHAEDAVKIIDSLPVQRVILAGHSMGAFIGAIAAGMTDKIVGLILLDGGGLLTREDAEKLIPALARIEKTFSGVEEYVEAVKPGYATLGLLWNRYIEAAARHEIGPWKDGLFKYKGDPERIKEDLLDIASSYDHQAIFSKVSCPILLVHAKGGMGAGPSLYSEASYDVTRKHAKNMEFYQTPANHYTMMLEHQPELNERVVKFIADCGM